MAWVYPQTIVSNTQWFDQPTGYGILNALQLGDNEFAWTPAGIVINELSLDFGQFCTQCHIRARRGTAVFNNAQLVVTFYDDFFAPQNTEQWIIGLVNTPTFEDFYYTPSFPWRYVVLEGESIQVEVAASVIRGEEFGIVSSRRLLTGVGL